MRFGLSKSYGFALFGLSIASSNQPHDWDTHAARGFNRVDPPRQTDKICPAPEEIPVTAPKKSPFASLSEPETKSVVSWLLTNTSLGLNLTDDSNPYLSLTDNYISHVEALKPNKTDVLSYLDGSGTVARYARVLIYHGSSDPPRLSEYSVGPLPINSETVLESLNYMYNGPNGATVFLGGAFYDSVRRSAVQGAFAKVMSGIADITADLIDMVYYGTGDPRTTAKPLMTNPRSADGTTMVVWVSWGRSTLAPYNYISDLSIRFNLTGIDPELYYASEVFYNQKLYKTVQDFRHAWEAGEIVKSPPPSRDTDFLLKDRRGNPRELENRFAPTVLALDGNRYKVDRDNQYIEYLGWKFYMRFDWDVGVQFYDIKFKDERIMYELSLQDAITQYSGNSPRPGSLALIDRHYGIGNYTTRLIPGYDCPYHATYLDTEFSVGTKPARQRSNICIFETDIGVPITRHREKSYVQSTKGSKLIVRMISTLENYDYLWDYGFYVDGTITVDAHASGYIQASYFRPDDEGKWGPRIHDGISGALHTHVMNFKADFDLVDAANTLIKTDIVVENTTRPWLPELGEFENMRYNISEIATEDDGLLPMPVNGQTMYTVVNKNHRNRWGQHRGYRILPGLSNVVLPVKNSPFFKRSANFAKYPFAVTRQHDTEPGSSAALNQNVPEAPLVDFEKFFDGESLVQEDLVAWVNLGMHHFTRSEDIPNTLMSEAHSSIMFAPHNWGDTELTTDLSNAVIFNAPKEGEEVVPEMNGVVPPTCLAMGPGDVLAGVFDNGRLGGSDESDEE